MTVVSRGIVFCTRFCQTSQPEGFPPHLPPTEPPHRPIRPGYQVSLRHPSHWRRRSGTTHFSAGQRVFSLLGRDRDFGTSPRRGRGRGRRGMGMAAVGKAQSRFLAATLPPEEFLCWQINTKLQSLMVPSCFCGVLFTSIFSKIPFLLVDSCYFVYIYIM